MPAAPSHKMDLLTLAFVLLLLLLPLHLPAAQSTPPLQGAALLKTDLLVVLAHPDDETMMAATIARYAANGKTVTHAYCTRGEGGGNMVGTQAGPALGILREVELRQCLAILGVHTCFFLDQLDFAYTESQAATLRTWDREAARQRLVRLIRALRPEILVTINPTPTPGQHGHHMAAGILATEAFLLAADPDHYPEQLSREGLNPWQARKLYWNGVAPGPTATITVTEPLSDGRSPADVAGQALSHHRSQAFGAFAGSPWLRRPQVFTLIRTTLPPATSETDLFHGLPLPASPPTPVLLPPPPSPPPAALQITFRPRPALTQFQTWCRQWNLSHVLSSVTADLPVVAGESQSLPLDLANPHPTPATATLRVDAPTGWSASLKQPRQPLPPHHTLTLPVRVTVPADARADVELTISSGQTSAVARLHPLPLARVPRLRTAPRLDGSEAGWDRAATLAIAPTQLAQGQVKDAADSSATVRLGHHDRILFVRIDVTDDIVVSNIATNDIKGHWRSDSVEICLDPAAGSEATLGCYKIGIFPFDLAGNVRAARDADARPGPIEESAPGTRLFSRRTPDGYRLEAAIPLPEIGRRVARGQRLGFNVIVYDGDKPDAAVGENINQSRIAWSPRPGVQGRPEDWGRIDLE